MKRLILTIMSILICALCASAAGAAYELENPAGDVSVVLEINHSGGLHYSISRGGRPVIEQSRLGIWVDGVELGGGVEFLGFETGSINETFETRVNHSQGSHVCNTGAAEIKHRKSGVVYSLKLRACNDGVAYRYIVPGEGERIISGEKSSWKLPGGATSWYQTNTRNYENEMISAKPVKKGEEIGPPVTVELPGGGYAAIMEAAVFDYSGMTLKAVGDNLLAADFLDDPDGWTVEGDVISPWRVTIIAGGLDGLVNSDMVLGLSPGPTGEIDNWDWVRPGRSTWSWLNGGRPVVTVENMMKYVDATSELGFEYLLVDDGWEDSPPVWRDMKGWSAPDKTAFDLMAGLVDYAATRDVDIWVWKHYHLLQASGYRRDYFRKLADIGVAGVKVDFMDSESVEMLEFYEDTLRDAAKNRLMINFHGANKPAGISRKWPNEMTREGIRGLEMRYLSPQHLTALPFTRLIAGHADFTPMHLQRHWMSGTTAAHQLASGIIFTSPVTFYGGYPPDYLDSPARGLIENMKAVWDETIVLQQSEIGETAAFARRSGNTWFIAVMHGGGSKKFGLPLDFLGGGRYIIEAYTDDPRDPMAVDIKKKKVTGGDTLPVRVRSLGGFAAIIRPE